MKITTYFLIFVLAGLMLSCAEDKSSASKTEEPKATASLLSYVNPLIGTTGHHATEYGGTIPAVLTPYGMTHWTAMTRQNKVGMSPYHHDDSTIVGFLGTHQPAVWMGDYGQVSFFPQTELQPMMSKRGVGFHHEDEDSHPNRYKVRMGNGVEVAMTATPRCARAEVNYPEGAKKILLVDASRMESSKGFIKVLPEQNMVVGYNPDRYSSYLSNAALPNFKGYFVIKFDGTFEEFGVYEQDSVLHEGLAEKEGAQLGAWLVFKGDDPLSFAVGTSFISIAQATENLANEISAMSFQEIADAGEKAWNEHLSRIQVETTDEDELAVFYTALYRGGMLPRQFSEGGRYYSAFDDTVHSGESYNDFSLWDTHRTLHPLLMWLAPDRVSGMMQALVQAYQEGGWLPKWPNPGYSNIMIGTHADAVLADAYVKGCTDFDAEVAYEAMRKNAMVPPEGDAETSWYDRQPNAPYEARGGLTWYKKLGYVPHDKTKESVSRTIEFSYGDFCVAQMAKALGKMDDYAFFMERSKNYKNLYNAERGLFAAKLSDGSWEKDTTIVYMPEFNLHKGVGFTEGSPYTYLFGALHDPEGMVELMGGKEAFKKRLEEIFSEKQYRHDNEPGHHYIYLFNSIGEYATTQKLVEEHIKANYHNGPAGLNGNDDCGQMSAWYVMSSLGIYPMPPSTEQYALGRPQFVSATLQKPNGGELRIQFDAAGSQKTITAVKLNEEVLPTAFVTHSQLLSADSLVFIAE